MRPIRVAVVDDSSFVRRAIHRLLRDEAPISVVGTAATGEELLARIDDWRPDVITLDLAMPGMGGLAALDRILERRRSTRVIILSTHSGRGAPQTIEALHRGAVDFIDKQRYSLMDFDALRQVLVQKIVEVHVGEVSTPTQGSVADSPGPRRSDEHRDFSLVVIGASTGGPPAIQSILESLPRDLPVPVVVAQHMPLGFTRAFADRLNAHLPFPVREVAGDGPILPGIVHVAPAGRHLVVRREGGLHARLMSQEGYPHSPSVDRLFSSSCEVLGRSVLAILLTGMGQDGARGMLQLRDAGAYTVAQDEATSVVYGMPAAAVALGAAVEVLPIGRIGPTVSRALIRGGP